MEFYNTTYREMADIVWKIRCEVKSRGADADKVASIGNAYDELDLLADAEEWEGRNGIT